MKIAEFFLICWNDISHPSHASLAYSFFLKPQCADIFDIMLAPFFKSVLSQLVKRLRKHSQKKRRSRCHSIELENEWRRISLRAEMGLFNPQIF